MANPSFSDITNIAKKWLDYLSPVLLLLAIIWLCWNLSRIVWLLLAPASAPNFPEVARQSQNMQVSNPNNFMIFAEPKVNEPVAEQSVAPSNIEVKGVMVATARENSSALLSVDGKVMNYRIQQKINGTNYRLKNVNWNEVVVEDSSNNQLTIKMNEAFQLNQKLKENKQDTENQAMITDMNAPPPPSFDGSSEFPMGNGGQTDSNPQAENDYDEDGNNAEPMEHAPPAEQGISPSEENPAGYLNQMGVLATKDGYEVTEAMSDELRGKSGLQLGDKIISINGESIGADPIADAEAFAHAKAGGQAKIQIKRGEQVITINQTF